MDFYGNLFQASLDLILHVSAVSWVAELQPEKI